MIYAITLDRSEVGHVMPVVDELRAMGREVRVVADQYNNLPTITHSDTVLCVGDRLQLLKFLVTECPDSKICQLHAGEDTSQWTEDNRYRWAISSLSCKRLFATKEASKKYSRGMYAGEYVGAPCLEYAEDRIRESKENPPLDGKDYVLFAMNAWLFGTQRCVNDCLKKTCKAAKELGWWVYTVVPNYETPYEIVVNEPNQIVQTSYSIPHDEFQRLIAGAHVIVGNSSAGIIEAPSLGTPTIDIQPRQEGRPRASSVLSIYEWDDKGRPSIDRMGEHIENALKLNFSVRPYDRISHPARVAAESVMWADQSDRFQEDGLDAKYGYKKMRREVAKEHDGDE